MKTAEHGGNKKEGTRCRIKFSFVHILKTGGYAFQDANISLLIRPPSFPVNTSPYLHIPFPPRFSIHIPFHAPLEAGIKIDHEQFVRIF